MSANKEEKIKEIFKSINGKQKKFIEREIIENEIEESEESLEKQLKKQYERNNV